MPIAHVIAFRKIEANRIPFTYTDAYGAARAKVDALIAQMKGA